jgi:hypothetical protein
MKITPCKKCFTDIAFVRMKSGKLNPISIHTKEKRIVLTPGDPEQEAKIVDTYLSHFIDCPDAASFRKES